MKGNNLKALKELKKEHKNLQDEMNKLKTQMIDKSKILMNELFKDFFVKYENVADKIHWTQYTPYFNDGESCEFGVHDVYLDLIDDEENDGEGSSLYSEKDILELEEKLKLYEDFNKDPRAAALAYQQKCLNQKHPYDPFKSDAYDVWNRKPKTTEDKIAEWKPFYQTYLEMQNQYEVAKEHIKLYPNLKDDFKELATIVSSIDDEVMEAAFGDHVQVIVTSKGIEIEEYDHD